MAEQPDLTGLAPLARVIAEKIRTVPVRHCPGGTDDLISELTLAVAIYVSREVLPPGLPAATVPASAPTDRAAILREAADTVDAMNEGCGRRQPCTSCNTREDVADLLRRLADAASGPGGAAGETQQDETQAAIIAELLPAWEAMYEPGNVSDYLIGYANDEAAARGAAEAWLRSQAEVTGRLEWVPQTPLDGYDQEAELIERHDDGIDTGPGITVRRRVEPAAVSQPGKEPTP